MSKLASTATAVTVTDAITDLLQVTEQRVRDGVRSPATLEMQKAHGRYWACELGPKTPIDQVDEIALEQIASRPRMPPKHARPGAGPETLRKRFSTWKAAMKLQARRRRLSRVPEFPTFIVPKPPEPTILRRYEDAVKLFESLPLHRAEWYWLALWSLQRPSDVNAMTWSDVDVKAGTMFVRSTKTKRPKLRVRIPRPLLSVLAEMAKRPHRDSDSVVRFWAPSRNITLARHCEKCGLPRMNTMAIRHTGASWVASETGITVSLARYMGHSSVRQLESTYAHYLPPQLQEVTDALERFAANTNGGGEKP